MFIDILSNSPFKYLQRFVSGEKPSVAAVRQEKGRLVVVSYDQPEYLKQYQAGIFVSTSPCPLLYVLCQKFCDVCCYCVSYHPRKLSNSRIRLFKPVVLETLEK